MTGPLSRAAQTAGVLGRFVGIRIVEINHRGCRLESPAPLHPGTQGTIRLSVDGETYYDDVRVVHCGAAGTSATYPIGVEFVGRVTRKESLIRHVLDRLTQFPGMASAARYDNPGSQPTHTGETTMKNVLLRLVREDEGQDLIEYALLAGFISLAAVAILTTLGTNLNTLFTTVNSKITAANASAS